MILASLTDTEFAATLSPQLQTALKFAKETDLQSLPAGKIVIDGDDIYAMVFEFDGKEPQDAKLETHIKYIDIQIPIASPEQIGWMRDEALTAPNGEYSESDDIAFFDDVPTTYINVTPGEYTIFFPKDAHAPGVAKGRIKKMVMKIKV